MWHLVPSKATDRKFTRVLQEGVFCIYSFHVSTRDRWVSPYDLMPVYHQICSPCNDSHYSHYTAMAQYCGLHVYITYTCWPFSGWSSSLDPGLIRSFGGVVGSAGRRTTTVAFTQCQGGQCHWKLELRMQKVRSFRMAWVRKIGHFSICRWRWHPSSLKCCRNGSHQVLWRYSNQCKQKLPVTFSWGNDNMKQS